jgi:hypothetical protein
MSKNPQTLHVHSRNPCIFLRVLKVLVNTYIFLEIVKFVTGTLWLSKAVFGDVPTDDGSIGVAGHKTGSSQVGNNAADIAVRAVQRLRFVRLAVRCSDLYRQINIRKPFKQGLEQCCRHICFVLYDVCTVMQLVLLAVRRSGLENCNLEIGEVGNKAVDTDLQASAPCSSSNVPSLI